MATQTMLNISDQVAEGWQGPGPCQVPHHPYRRRHHHRGDQRSARRLWQVQVHRHKLTGVRHQRLRCHC